MLLVSLEKKVRMYSAHKQPEIKENPAWINEFAATVAPYHQVQISTLRTWPWSTTERKQIGASLTIPLYHKPLILWPRRN